MKKLVIDFSLWFFVATKMENLMKKIICMLVFVFAAVSLFAGGTENKLNQSPGYSRFPAKNTETRKPDAVFFNPAGTALMEDGLYFALGNQFIYKKYTNVYAGKDYVTDEPSLIFPDLDIVWKHDDLALFTGFNMFAGGGGLEWEDGNAFTVQRLGEIGSSVGFPELRKLRHDMTLFSVVYGNMTGMAHTFLDDRLSVAVAGKILYGYQTSKVTMKDKIPVGPISQLLGNDNVLADTKATGMGFGAVFGIDYKPVPEWTFAATYHTQTVVNFEYKKADGVGASMLGAKKGEKFDYNIPAFLALGAGWQVCDPLFLAVGANYYFNRQADYDYHDAWEINFAGEYRFNKYIAASLGGFYSNVGTNGKDSGNNYFNPVLNSMTYCGGMEVDFCDRFSIDLGGFYTQYFAEHWHGAKIKKLIWEISLGFTYKMF